MRIAKQISRAAAIVAAALIFSGCMTASYHVETIVGGEPTSIDVMKTWPPWTEISGADINLATGVDADGNWYIITGDAIQGLTQNPAVASAIVQGMIQGLAEAAKSGLFSPP